MENKQIINAKDLTLETALLKTMAIKQNYKLYINSVDRKRLLPATSLLLVDYGKYFDLFPSHETVDFGQFQTQFTQNWHNSDLDQLDIEYYRDYVFPAILSTPNEEDLDRCILGLMHKQTAEELSVVANTDFDIVKLREILERHENKEQLILGEKDDDAISAFNVDLEVLDKSQGIPYFLPSLQASLGGLIQGQFVVLSADSGTGKSAFTISQAAHAFKWLGKHKDKGPILYFNSEGTPGDIYGRLWANLYHESVTLGMEEIVERREEMREKFTKSFDASKFLVFQIFGKNVSYIRAKLKKYKPSLVILDMIDTLADVEDAVSLKKLYDNIRGLSLESCAIIGTTQSGNTTWFDKDSGKEKSKKFLTDKDVLGCKAKGAASETMITIGKSPDNPRLRYISTPKKKRGKMVNITCEILEEYSLYKELTF